MLLILHLVSSQSKSQDAKDSLRFDGIFQQNSWMTDEKNFSLGRKVIPYDLHYNFPALAMLSDPVFKPFADAHQINIPKEVLIWECRLVRDTVLNEAFYQKSDSLSDLLNLQSEGLSLRFLRSFTLLNCESRSPVSLSHLKTNAGWIHFTQNDLSTVLFDDIQTPLLIFTENKISALGISHSHVNGLIVNKEKAGRLDSLEEASARKYTELVSDSSNSSFASYYLNADNSVFDQIRIWDMPAGVIVFNFEKDTINQQFIYSEVSEESFENEHDFGELMKRYKKDSFPSAPGSVVVSFSNCDIDASVINVRGQRSLAYVFDKCSFGSKADLSSLSFDTLVITNCTRIASDLYLDMPRNHDAYFSVFNSDLKKIHFEYGSHLHFIPDLNTALSRDQVRNAYAELLSKFKTEGRTESFEKLDVEFEQWKYRQRGWSGAVMNFVDRVWWYYGYRKAYVLLWTLAFLLLFSIINFFLWNDLRKTYPIIEEEKASYYERANNKRPWLAKVINVLIVTFYIYFSFKIEFNKISYKHTRILAYFFFQYIVGIICIFFILNYMLKI